MDLYSDPPESMLITGITQWFQMPEESGKGTIPAIAVSKSQGDLWNSGYTLLLILMFAAIGKLITDVVITFFPLNGDGNRTAMLVAYFNTADPMAAMGLLLTYQYKMLFNVHGKGYDAADDPKSRAHEGNEPVGTKPRPWFWTRLWNHKWHKVDWSAFLLALVLWTIGAGLFAASFTAGLLVPTNMLMGSVARVQPSAIFYFTQPVETAVAQQQTGETQEEAEAARLARMIEAQQRYQYSAATRAIGTVEQNKQVLREKVKFNTTKMLGAGGFEDGLEFDYSYEITGLDFGLQRAPELSQEVTGHCQTQFDWYDEGTSNATAEWYKLWPGTLYNITYRYPTDELIPPKATFLLANPAHVTAEEGVSLFSIIPNVAFRASGRSVSGDIWYSTMDATSNSSRAPFAVRTGRPPLSCTEKLIWKFHGLEVPTNELGKAAQVGLKLEQFWWDQVFYREFGAAPKIVQVGKALGTGSLTSVSRGFADANFIATAVANATQDLEHISLASYVAAREVVRNTALLNVERGDLQNLAEFDDGGSRSGKPLGKVPDERADFVLKSSEISTLSVRVMIIVPALLVVLWLVSALRRQIFRETGVHATNIGFKSKYLARSTGFQAVHLYRFLDEETCGKRRWDGRMSSAPYISDQTNENQMVPERLFQCHTEHDMDVIPVSAQLSDGKGALNLEHVPAAKYNAVIKKDLPVGDNLDCPWPNCRPIIRNYITPKLVPIFRHVSDKGQINEEGVPGIATSIPETPSDIRSDPILVAEHQSTPESDLAGPHSGETPVPRKSLTDRLLFRSKQDPHAGGASNTTTTNEERPEVQLTDKEKSDMHKLAAFFKTKKDLEVETDSYDLAMTYVYRPQLTPLAGGPKTPKWSDISNYARPEMNGERSATHESDSTSTATAGSGAVGKTEKTDSEEAKVHVTSVASTPAASPFNEIEEKRLS